MFLIGVGWWRCSVPGECAGSAGCYARHVYNRSTSCIGGPGCRVRPHANGCVVVVVVVCVAYHFVCVAAVLWFLLAFRLVGIVAEGRTDATIAKHIAVVRGAMEKST